MVLTPSVFESADGVGQQPHTAQEASPLLLVDLLVVPHADGYGIAFPNISKNNTQHTFNCASELRESTEILPIDLFIQRNPFKIMLVLYTTCSRHSINACLLTSTGWEKN